MLRVVVLCLLALTLAGNALAQLQGPAPPVGEQRQAQPDPAQKGRASNPEPTAQPPIIVNIQPTPKTDAGRAEEAHERQEKANLDRQLVEFTAGLYYATIALAAATIFLVIVTGGLGVFAAVQSRDMKKSIAIAAKAADAAELSARAAIGMELPIIRSIRYPWLLALDGPPTNDKAFDKGGAGTQSPVAYSRIVSMRFQNAGRTAAFPFRIDAGWTVCPELPDLGDTEPPYLVSSQFSPTAFIGENEGELDAPTIRKAVELTPDQIGALKAKETLLWLYIALHYRDFLGNAHTAKFLYSGPGTNFGISQDPPAGYTGRA